MSIIRVYDLRVSTNDACLEFNSTNASYDYAVAYAYCKEHGQLYWLKGHATANTLDKAYDFLPMRRTMTTVICDNYLVRKDENTA